MLRYPFKCLFSMTLYGGSKTFMTDYFDKAAAGTAAGFTDLSARKVRRCRLTL